MLARNAYIQTLSVHPDVIKNVLTDITTWHERQLRMLLLEQARQEREEKRQYELLQRAGRRRRGRRRRRHARWWPLCWHTYACVWKDSGRCHNKGNGRGKYRLYKCTQCGRVQKRY